MTDPRDDLDRWLRPRVDPMSPPTGQFAAIRRRARRRRWARATSTAAAVAAICIGGVFGGLLAAGGEEGGGVVLPPPVVASSPASSPSPSPSSTQTSEASRAETPSTPPTDEEEEQAEPESTLPVETPPSDEETDTDDGSGTNSPTQEPTSDSPTTQCRVGQLSVEAQVEGAGTGSTFWDLVFTNVSGSSCTVEGYPDLVLLDADRDRLRTEVRTMPPRPYWVRLAPGDRAVATVRVGNVRDPERDCQPPSKYALVTPPGGSEQVTIPFESRSCHGEVWVSGVAGLG